MDLKTLYTTPLKVSEGTFTLDGGGHKHPSARYHEGTGGQRCAVQHLKPIAHCTRPIGHSGEHEAHSYMGKLYTGPHGDPDSLTFSGRWL